MRQHDKTKCYMEYPVSLTTLSPTLMPPIPNLIPYSKFVPCADEALLVYFRVEMKYDPPALVQLT